eukprot:CAMPEP_0180801238 /NCGR_PEP_ID=MMETSP1038_2-20121128/59542_1 /TAXON_ID=632150 /ORGANISM="Azadinium spinosum, Strain 3D9" /LENGTH=42 /DNA_ID= /DNA_START= /DNA_END= /DNA_ORIENTATION=
MTWLVQDDRAAVSHHQMGTPQRVQSPHSADGRMCHSPTLEWQ